MMGLRATSAPQYLMQSQALNSAGATYRQKKPTGLMRQETGARTPQPHRPFLGPLIYARSRCKVHAAPCPDPRALHCKATRPRDSKRV